MCTGHSSEKVDRPKRGLFKLNYPSYVHSRVTFSFPSFSIADAAMTFQQTSTEYKRIVSNRVVQQPCPVSCPSALFYDRCWPSRLVSRPFCVTRFGVRQLNRELSSSPWCSVISCRPGRSAPSIHRSTNLSTFIKNNPPIGY